MQKGGQTEFQKEQVCDCDRSMSQPQAPIGGFPGTVRYQRYLPKRGPSGAFIFTVIGGIMGYGAYRLADEKEEQR
jgi:NADH dehydrogenase (ubiquinone) 1 alpha subcomplex subunit 13